MQMLQLDRQRYMQPRNAAEQLEIDEARQFIPDVPDFTYLRENYYVNRDRRSAVEGSSSFNEDVVLCMCNGEGCGENCMNRMVMYECLPGHCTEPNCRNQVQPMLHGFFASYLAANV
eukprot:SAG31_NODE_1106_length_9878_cov_4.621331_14_plen_117_part_00